jgi:hypothetical protein
LFQYKNFTIVYFYRSCEQLILVRENPVPMPYKKKTLQEELIELKSQAVNLQLKIQKTMAENSVLYYELAATTLKLAEQERKLEQKLKQKLFKTVSLNDDPERDDCERKFITKHQNSPSNPSKLSKM